MCILRPLMVLLWRPHSLQLIANCSSSAGDFLRLGTEDPDPVPDPRFGAEDPEAEAATDRAEATCWSGYSS